MESLTWFLTFAVLAVWVMVGIDLIRRPLPFPGSLERGARRLLWGALWLGAGLAGIWGPELWSQTTVDHPTQGVVAGAAAERSESVIRTPFAVQITSVQRDSEARLVQADQRLSLQLPVFLMAFLGGVFLLRKRGSRSKAGRGASMAGTATLVLLLAACGSESDELDGSQAPRPDRTLVEAAWDTLALVQTPPEDTLLFNAGHVTAADAGFWILDRLGFRVAHFDWNGELQWYAGRRGGGPGEFTNPRNLALDQDQVVWVLDADNHRISGFDLEGRLHHELSLGQLERTLQHFAVAPDGQRFFSMVFDDILEPVLIHAHGGVEYGPSIPIRDAGEAAWGMAFQGSSTPTAVGDRWFYAFSMGDGLFPMDGMELARDRIRYPEWIPFPRLIREERRDGNVTNTTTRIEEPTFAAQDIHLSADRVYIRFAGNTEEAGRLVDVYDAWSGDYQETLLLPSTGRLAVWEDRFVLARASPSVEILVLRPAVEG